MICLTVDCEQWNSPKLRGVDVKENDNTEFSKDGNDKLLELFSSYQVKSTFFITGFFAEKEPVQVKQILKKNHEIACHGYEHWYRDNPAINQEEDITHAKKVLEKIAGVKVMGFRAPQMQYNEGLLHTLQDQGFRYDSSLNPAWFPFWINNKNMPLSPFKIKGCSVMEIPVGARPGSRFPLSWMFLRTMPYGYVKGSIRKLIDEKITPVLYIHSWEAIPLKSPHVPWYFRRNTGKRFLRRLERLFHDFEDQRFTTVDLLYEQLSPRRSNKGNV